MCRGPLPAGWVIAPVIPKLPFSALASCQILSAPYPKAVSAGRRRNCVEGRTRSGTRRWPGASSSVSCGFDWKVRMGAVSLNTAGSPGTVGTMRPVALTYCAVVSTGEGAADEDGATHVHDRDFAGRQRLDVRGNAPAGRHARDGTGDHATLAYCVRLEPSLVELVERAVPGASVRCRIDVVMTVKRTIIHFCLLGAL